MTDRISGQRKQLADQEAKLRRDMESLRDSRTDAPRVGNHGDCYRAIGHLALAGLAADLGEDGVDNLACQALVSIKMRDTEFALLINELAWESNEKLDQLVRRYAIAGLLTAARTAARQSS